MTLGERNRRRLAGILTPPCVDTSERSPTQALSFSLPDGETVGLMWSRFVSVRLRGDVLTLKFVDDEVVVHGQNLSSVFKDALSLSIDYLRTIPATYRPVLGDNEPIITEIEVRPVKS